METCLTNINIIFIRPFGGACESPVYHRLLASQNVLRIRLEIIIMMMIMIMMIIIIIYNHDNDYDDNDDDDDDTKTCLQSFNSCFAFCVINKEETKGKTTSICLSPVEKTRVFPSEGSHPLGNLKMIEQSASLSLV